MTEPKPISLDYAVPDENPPALAPEPLKVFGGGLYDYLIELEARVTAIETIEGGGTYSTQPGTWQVNPQPGVAPGGTQVSADSAMWSSATWLRFRKIDIGGTDLSTFLNLATDIYGQMKRDASNRAVWTVTGAATDGGDYIEVPVSYISGEGSLDAAQWQEAVVVIKYPI